MKLFYIRHAPTKANVSGDIVKDYDSYDILDFDRDEWMKKVGCHLPKDFKLFVSPAKRCRQTAEILFPGQRYEIIPDLTEFDVSGLDLKGLKFWEIDEKTFRENVYLSKYDARNHWANALIEIVRRRGPVDKDAVIIGHGFYGRLVHSIYNNDDDTPFQILNSTNFEFKNLDMMEIEHCEVQRVFRS